MKIALASDHGGFNLKGMILDYLEHESLLYEDLGSYDREKVDYPDFTLKVAEGVAAGEYEKGIVICSTGLGVSMVCNKVPGIRAALCADCFSARYAREHNDANILALGERVVGTGLALSIVEVFLHTPFQGGRHQRRLDKIGAIEKKYGNGIEIFSR